MSHEDTVYWPMLDGEVIEVRRVYREVITHAIEYWHENKLVYTGQRASSRDYKTAAEAKAELLRRKHNQLVNWQETIADAQVYITRLEAEIAELEAEG